MNPTNAHALIHNSSFPYRCCHAVTSTLSVMSRRVIRVEDAYEIPDPSGIKLRLANAPTNTVAGSLRTL